MDKKLKAKWVKALRSGEFVQGTGSLYSDGRYCCLGVLACVFNKATGRDSAFGYKEGFDNGYHLGDVHAGENKSKLLQCMNDGYQRKQKSFTQIADYIEKHIK